ncbi:phosphoserine phosphatase SerB [Arthrobacter sp. UM1]|nr:phosphoserine phosphatase SerB [Arthrobacter sp. UM1]
MNTHQDTTTDPVLAACSWTGRAPEESLPELGELLSQQAEPGEFAFVVGPAAAPGPKAIAFDVDSTLIEQEVIELLAERAGKREQVAEVTAAAMRGELDFAESLRARVKTLEGLPESVLEETAGSITPTTGAREFIAFATARGHAVGAVSGGFTRVLTPHAEEWGLTDTLANGLGVEDGRLTGAVEGEIVTAETKRDFCLRLGGPETTARVAVGDGANDVLMVQAADLGVAFCAKPVLAEAAHLRLEVRHLGALAAIVNLNPTPPAAAGA